MWRAGSLLILGVVLTLSRSAGAQRKDAPGPGATPVVTLTEKAAGEVKTIALQQKIKSYWLRVGVKSEPGKKSFRYLLDITEDVPDPKHDEQTVSNGVRIVVDAKSAIYLQGTTIDFRETEGGKGFYFINPNAKSTGDE